MQTKRGLDGREANGCQIKAHVLRLAGVLDLHELVVALGTSQVSGLENITASLEPKIENNCRIMPFGCASLLLAACSCRYAPNWFQPTVTRMRGDCCVV